MPGVCWTLVARALALSFFVTSAWCCRFCVIQVSNHTLMTELEENTCIFLFHKKNFRNCSHFIALILTRKYKKKEQICFSKKSSLDASELV